jgi:hypothetical protein
VDGFLEWNDRNAQPCFLDKVALDSVDALGVRASRLGRRHILADADLETKHTL